MSAWGAASTAGGATGVLAGGLLAGTFGWSSVFLVTVPVSLAAVALAPTFLDDAARGPRRRFDAAGAVTITAAVLALVHGALGAVDGGWTSPCVVASLAAAAVLLATFIAVERRAADPLVPLDLFRSRVLTTGVALAVFGGAARASTFVLVALYLQQALAMSPQHAGLAMVPTSLTGFVVSLALLPRVLRAIGPRRSLVTGLVILAAGHLWLALRAVRRRLPDRRPPGAAAGRDRCRTQLHAHDHGHRLRSTRLTRRPRVRAGELDHPGRRGTRHRRLHRDRTLRPAAPALGCSLGFSAAFTAAAVVALATALLGCTIVRR